jgi:pyruvate dehydrogenase E1 component alpha subunit
VEKKDPIPLLTERLRDWGYLNDVELAEQEAGVAAEVAEAVVFAEAGPWEPVEDLLKDVSTPVT